MISVTGGSGFVGRHLVTRLAEAGHAVRVLTRNPMTVRTDDPRIVPVIGDLRDGGCLADFIADGATIVHLAYSSSLTAVDNIRAAETLAAMARDKGARRFIHVSTAAVAGRTHEDVVDETTPCRPANEYERTKLAIEQRIDEILSGRDFVVLRPAAVFGAGGQNLVALARSLMTRSRRANSVRAMVMGARRMNLVAVENVVEAIVFLIQSTAGFRGERFVVSDDDAPQNNFRDVVQLLSEGLEIPASRPPFDASFVLPVMLRLMRRPLTNPRTQFSAAKLRTAGFQKRVEFPDAVHRFGEWFRTAPLRDDANP